MPAIYQSVLLNFINSLKLAFSIIITAQQPFNSSSMATSNRTQDLPQKIGVVNVNVPSAMTIGEALARLARNPYILSVHPYQQVPTGIVIYLCLIQCAQGVLLRSFPSLIHRSSPVHHLILTLILTLTQTLK
jgi:hypothetical protein